MKHKTIISLIAATGMAAPALSALASGFGGGWMHDKHTGTLYSTLAPEPVRHQGDSENAGQKLNSFGGGLVQDKYSGTLYSTQSPQMGRQADSHGKTGGPNSFGGGWVKDKSSNTLSYRPEEIRQTAYD
jgi:hypothetical protein